MTPDIRLRSMALLEWLHDNPGQSASRSPFASASDELRDLVNYLADRRLVKNHSGFGRADADIATRGTAAVQEIRAARKSPAQRTARAAMAQTHLLHWLDDQDATPSDCAGALAGLDADELGTEFTMRDIARAATYLREKGLISAQRTWQSDFLRPALTHTGRTCVTDFGGNVSDYLNTAHGGNSTTNNFSGNFTSSNISAGDHNTQNMTTGLDTARVLEFAEFVTDAMPAFKLSPEDHDILEAQVQELQQEAVSPNAEPGRLRDLLNRVVTVLTGAASGAVVDVATGLGDQAREAIQAAITGG